ncbi:MAG TPA: hypothetical protein VMB85_01035 [Bryobacteraceae bacterium]|jgi:hypothetical protein|nr:hypothetical protein [Bryobacteraceae bacterium]
MDTAAISQILQSWHGVPKETHREYFRVWQRVAVELEKALRRWIPERYFQDLNRFEDRAAAYPMIIYAASRPCYGRPKTEFTYDVADPATLSMTLRSIGNPTRKVLAAIEARLREAGRPDLAIRYAPVWHQDIFRDVQKKPKMLMELLAHEARLVDAVIHLGTTRKIARFERATTLALWSVAGQDMRELVIRALELTTDVLESCQRQQSASQC